MNELEQLRAQVIELTAENGRLRGAITEAPHYCLPEYNQYCPDETGVCDCWKARALSQPAPTGAGEKVLALARAAYKLETGMRYIPGVDPEPDFRDMLLWHPVSMAVDRIIESPELRQWLGV